MKWIAVGCGLLATAAMYWKDQESGASVLMLFIALFIAVFA